MPSFPRNEHFQSRKPPAGVEESDSAGVTVTPKGKKNWRLLEA
jgi:hypothetical protein